MIFNINYPTNLESPKGLFLPELEVIRQSIGLAKEVLVYIDPGYDDDDQFAISVTDEVSVLNGRLVNSRNTGEGTIIYPSPTPWSVGTVLGIILYCLLEQ